MRPGRPPRYALILACLSGVALAGFGIACSGSKSKSATPSPVTTEHAATATAERAAETPTPAPADPKLAASLRYEGEYEQAINVYAAVATSDDGQQRQDALLAQAQLLTRTGKSAAARDVLNTG